MACGGVLFAYHFFYREKMIRVMAALGFVALGYGFATLHSEGRVWALGAGAVTALYYAGGRRLPVFKTSAIAIAWCGATLLPLSCPHPLPDYLWAAAAHRFLLIAALALAYDIVDMTHDPNSTIAQRLGKRKSEALAYLLLLAAAGAATGMPADFQNGLYLSALLSGATLRAALRFESAPWYARKAAIDAVMPLHLAVNMGQAFFVTIAD